MIFSQNYRDSAGNLGGKSEAVFETPLDRPAPSPLVKILHKALIIEILSLIGAFPSARLPDVVSDFDKLER